MIITSITHVSTVYFLPTFGGILQERLYWKYWNVHPLKVVPDDDRGSCKGKHSSDVFLGVFATT